MIFRLSNLNKKQVPHFVVREAKRKKCRAEDALDDHCAKEDGSAHLPEILFFFKNASFIFGFEMNPYETKQ